MNYNKKMGLPGFNKKTIIIVMSIIILILLFVLVVINSTQKNNTRQPVVSFSPPPQTNPPSIPREPSNGIGPNTDLAGRQKYDADQANQRRFVLSQEKISQLITRLPYSGNYFTLTYNIKTNRFAVVADQDNQTTGITEFNQFLSNQGLDKQYMEIDIIYK